MVRWILAAIAVPFVALAIGLGVMWWDIKATPPLFDPKTYDHAAAEKAHRVFKEYEPVSLVALLADPLRYDGRKVRTQGFVTLRFEDAGLHLDGTAYYAGLRRNAVWLDFSRASEWANSPKLDRRYGEVAGTFDAEMTGHMGAYAGALIDLQTIEPRMSLAEFQQYRLDTRSKILFYPIDIARFLTLMGWLALWIAWLFRRRPA